MFGDEVGNGDPADPLHHHERPAVVHPDVVNRWDPGVFEPGGDAGFAHEAADEFLVVDAVGEPDQLHRDLAFQLDVSPDPHLAHASPADRQGLQLVALVEDEAVAIGHRAHRPGARVPSARPVSPSRTSRSPALALLCNASWNARRPLSALP